MDVKIWIFLHYIIYVGFWCLAHFTAQIAGQQTETSDSQPQAKKLEDTVVTDMLKIVDNKFDTLTTRITALERAVSNLQFYSIRQFRQINGRLQIGDNGLDAVSKQVGQLEVDGRSIKISLSLFSRDMSELKSSASGILEELESSVAYINENVDKQIVNVKAALDEAVVKLTQDTLQTVSRQLENFTEHNQREPEPQNCTADMTSLKNYFDLKFTDFKLATHNMLEAAVKNLHSSVKMSDNLEQLSSNQSEHKHENEKIAQSTKHSAIGNSLYNLSYEQNEMDEQVISALGNMTSSVLQAVSYLRSTGGLLEHIASNTDVLLSSQSDLTQKLKLAQSAKHSFVDKDEFEVSNNIPGAMVNEGTSQFAQAAYKPFPLEIAWKFANIIQNGSQLLEVLTDLAQLSSVSLSQATSALNDEVKRMEGIRTSMATAYLARTSEDEAMQKLINATEKIRKLVEITSSSTDKYLPLIFYSTQNMEALTNRSMYLTNRNYNLLIQAQQNIFNKTRRNEHGSDLESSSFKGPQNYQQPIKNIGDSTKEFRSLDKESFDTIYSTSLQLNRIMPALTKLLSEPDPLITLVDGSRADQGRVEIYYKGQWGMLCHNHLTHMEADMICRHLGFRGGISAGAGYFGAGTGIAWIFNASCLVTSHCPVVNFSESAAYCNQERAAAVICDHMLRIVSLDGSKKSKVGRLEIHHKGIWVPICDEGWSGFSAQVACRQMGFTDGREIVLGKWEEGSNSTWLSQVSCTGGEARLDACDTQDWMGTCPQLTPAGVRCL